MKRFQLVAILLIAAALPAACSPKVDTGGYVSKQGSIRDQIAIGDARDDVLVKLGSPSSQSSFGDEAWYYITDRKESYAFLKPEIVQQDIVRIEFDEAGHVTKIDNYDESNAQDFALTKRKTPTEGHTLGFVEQILGNIGRFNKSDTSGAGSAAPGRKPGRGAY